MSCFVGICGVISNSTSKLSSCILARYRLPSVGTLEVSLVMETRKKNPPLPIGDDGAAKIHCLKLRAYPCTLEALYASGPISWEQEALSTSLRITLHISNDEHLMQLRNLISAATS